MVAPDIVMRLRDQVSIWTCTGDLPQGVAWQHVQLLLEASNEIARLRMEAEAAHGRD